MARPTPMDDGSVRGQYSDRRPPSGSSTVDTTRYAVEPYVPIPRPVTGEALITTGSDPVRIPVFVDTTSPRGVGIASDINSILNADRYSKSDANSLWDQLPRETQNALTQIAKSQGGRSGKALWERSVSSSYVSTKQGDPRSPWDFIQAAGGDVSGGGTRGRSGGRAAAYTGPVESVSVAAETDIIAMAQATAQEILGRSATQKELDKILKRTRKAEQEQPTVQTRQGPGRVTTEEGLTKEGRDAILNQVLMQSPDYAGYQMDSTVMDMFSNVLRRGQEVASG
jgi:hypothetical protein